MNDGSLAIVVCGHNGVECWRIRIQLSLKHK